jgi:ectoine hydroxylase-related dioxygenase (phytanoyl-CoA dioxygenase family)
MGLTVDQQQQWSDNGYLILKHVYPPEYIDSLNNLIDNLWEGREQLTAQYVIDIFVESENEKRIFFADAPKEARQAPYKLNDLFLTSEQIRMAAAGEILTPILSELLDGFPMICNTLNFEYGSQQDYHVDTFYMPSPTPNKMIASWLALEDATLRNGPLTYYPGSHNIPPFLFSNGSTLVVPEEMGQFNAYMQEEIAKRNLRPVTFMAEKGDVLIWHSQLYHGGCEILDKGTTRKSLVTHYFTKEDFPDIEAPLITDSSCYMNRYRQPTGYKFTRRAPVSPTPAKRSWLRRLFP